MSRSNPSLTKKGFEWPLWVKHNRFFFELFDTYHFSGRCQCVAHNKTLCSFFKWAFKHYFDTTVCILYDENSNETNALFYYSKVADSSKRNRNTGFFQGAVL